jgi:hypothetical protein
MIGITMLYKKFLPLAKIFHFVGKKKVKPDLFQFTEDDYEQIF